MTSATDCTRSCARNCGPCLAFGAFCEGCEEPCQYAHCDGNCDTCPVRCGRRTDLGRWLVSVGGLALDVPLLPQPGFDLAGYVPQLLNGLEVPAVLQRVTDVAVGIAKVLTPRGQVSRRALPREFGPRDLRAQWGLDEGTRLLCVGNYLDDYLEQLWAAQGEASPGCGSRPWASTPAPASTFPSTWTIHAWST